jgi:DNA modification methylase
VTDLARLIHGSAHDLPLDDGSVQAVITSPPYMGLRRYDGEQEIDWPAVSYSPMAGLPPLELPAQRAALGNEPTLESYIAHLILCAREWRRVLRDDGVVFCNLGDSYAGSSNKSGEGETRKTSGPKFHGGKAHFEQRRVTGISPVPPKNLLMVPARFALAMQADGWILRSEMVWAKPNPMPESVTDRPTKAHEMIYLFSKRERYYWDTEATRLPPAPGNDGTIRARARTAAGALGGANQHNIEERIYAEIKGANMRSVLTITTPKVTLRDDLDAETRARVIAQLVERGLL